MRKKKEGKFSRFLIFARCHVEIRTFWRTLRAALHGIITIHDFMCFHASKRKRWENPKDSYNKNSESLPFNKFFVAARATRRKFLIIVSRATEKKNVEWKSSNSHSRESLMDDDELRLLTMTNIKNSYCIVKSLWIFHERELSGYPLFFAAVTTDRVRDHYFAVKLISSSTWHVCTHQSRVLCSWGWKKSFFSHLCH